jgi:hypothetical protein
VNYTPAQTRWFVRAIDAEQREAHRLAVVAARVAQAGDGKTVANYLDALNNAAATAGAPRRRRV